MKNLQLILSIAVLACFTSHVQAQKHSFTPESKTIKLVGISELEIIGYDGNEIEITNKYHQKHNDSDRAKGLKLIKSDGLSDNTGIGLSLKNSADGVLLSKISSNSCEDESFSMKVPKSSNIFFEHVSWSGDDLKVKNISGEVNISTNYNDVFISQVSGPIAVKTVYGAIEVSLDKLANNGTVSLYSIYEYVDLSIPSTSNANVNMTTTYGNIYSDIDIKVNEKNKKKNNYFGESVKGTISGGGPDIILNSTYDDIYLRKN